ncbi:isochorismatase family protein [Nitratireductor sp. XY-223]|uniref:isochorismatase family protein n=1 Tax=Nitratireductor sp. XY-223 TaxID=2561926 RepID=UPI0010A9B6DC|nr:isochorismatase family protein [Nitratireductor sp. XY-223]
MSHEAVEQGFHELIDEYAPVRQLGTGFAFTEGPLWHPLDKHLIFSDMPGDVRRKWRPGEGVSELQRPSNMGNGMTYDADLNLLVCEHATSAVARIRRDGVREVLCSHFEGRELNSPNDICVRSDGRIYFTDPTYGRMPYFGVERPTQQGFQGVYMLPADHRPGDEPVLASDRYTFTQPNGLCFSPCERWMWVNDTEQANIRMFDVADDGRLTNGRVFASGIKDTLKPGVPDGMKADIKGNVWVTAPGGVWVYSFDGQLIGKIAVPELVANIHWGDDDWQTLFMCASTSLYSVRTKIRGRTEPFMNPRAPTAPRAAAPTAGASQAGPPLRKIDPARTALIIQDLQNDVIIDGGAFADSGSPQHARAQNVVENTRRLAEACRAKGMLVIHVWMVCEPGHPKLAQHAALFQGLKGENALVRGTWGVAPATGLEPQGNDLVVEKMSMSAWETSRLESYLRHAGCDTIINTGAWTNMSVEHTARTGADKGFRIIVPENACSTMNADWHRASIGYAMQNVADITHVDAVVAALG